MSDGNDQKQHPAVLLIERDSTHRAMLEQACRLAGVSVLAISSMREVEHWPVGQIVITDIPNLTPWWRRVGAVEVVVLVEDAREGIAALANGATRWLRLPCDPAAVAAMVLVLAAKGSSSDLGV
jgi:DNA-binding response OmpR family regulator